MGESTEELTSQIEDTRGGWLRPRHPPGPGEPLGDRRAPQASGRDRFSSVKDKVMGGAERQGLRLLDRSSDTSKVSGAATPPRPPRSGSRVRPSPPAWWPSAPASCSPPYSRRAAPRPRSHTESSRQPRSSGQDAARRGAVRRAGGCPERQGVRHPGGSSGEGQRPGAYPEDQGGGPVLRAVRQGRGLLIAQP